MRPWLIGIVWIGLITGINACNFPDPSGAAEVSSTNSSSAKTFNTIETQVALALTPTPEPRFYLPVPPTVTLSPEMAGLTVPKNARVPCNRAAFISDVTIPDGIEIPPGTEFTKTWEIQNNGSCTWDPTYTVTFSGEESALGGEMPAPIMANGNVEPGENIQISYKLIAPNEIGNYRSDLKLMDENGNLFGIGEDGDQAFWLEIEVANRFRFAENLCSANWQNSSVDLTCPMEKNITQGYAMLASQAESEIPENLAGTVLLMVPGGNQGGLIKGEYEAILVPDGAHFQSILGCLDEDNRCSAVFELGYRLEGGYEAVLGTWPVMNEGNITSIDLDLAQFGLPGSNVEFILSVTSTNSSGEDQVFLVDPQIITPP